MTEDEPPNGDRPERTRLLHAILDTVEASIFVVDADDRYLLMNQRARELLGIDDESVEGRTNDDLFPRDLATQFQTNNQRVFDTREPVEFEQTVPTQRGLRTYLTRITPLSDSDGTVYACCGIASDITERQRREQQLQAQNERLETFASVVSHDLRNPLNVAEGRLRLAQDECENAHLEKVSRAHERMDQLIDDLLTLSRTGTAMMNVEPIALGDFSELSWRDVSTGNAVLETAADGVVWADRSRLRQLLENLFRNAIEHVGEDVTVTVGTIEDGFYVEDDGPGIPEGKRERVFDRGVSTKQDGTGFGLHIVEQIADDHGWERHLTASSVGGPRFEFTSVNTEDPDR